MKRSDSFWNNQIGWHFVQVVSENFAIIYFTDLAAFCYLYDLSEKHALFCSAPPLYGSQKSKHCQILKWFLQSKVKKGKRR